MTDWFFIKCFLVGLSAATAMGPIFVLTFNNSATRGFLKGFFTAIGAALGDGILLFLGFMGMLSILEQSKGYQLAIDCTGGFLLLAFGLFMILSHSTRSTDVATHTRATDSLILTALKAFLSTVVNPLTLFFFMFVSAQLLPEDITLSTNVLATASSIAGVGSLFGLSCVAYAAHVLGKAMNPKHLRFISHITGCIVMCIGAYFFFDAVKVIINWWN